jgi:hypothetical protein
MKKTEVLAANSAARRACEIANASLRDTANVWDLKAMRTRPATEEERKNAIIDAYFWSTNALVRARDAATLTLQFAHQNGITVSDIDQRVKELNGG